jgi:glycosyltransferase involved in cell wall biosynthesis
MIKISVLMSVYNGEKYLKEAIDSVLSQTEKNLEFIIVNDGSTDSTDSIIKSYSDPRIKYFNVSHMGRVPALNFGIGKCSGEYIAVLDADDISVPERLEKELSFMQANDLVLCGSWATLIDEDGNNIGSMTYPPIKQGDIRKYSLLHNPFIHSSIMVKRDALIRSGLYRASRYAEDYELWTRIMYKHKVANIPEELIKYRRHTSQLTQSSIKKVRLDALKVRLLVWWRFIFRFYLIGLLFLSSLEE